jgi:hypothetical protein
LVDVVVEAAPSRHIIQALDHDIIHPAVLYLPLS